VTSEARDNGEHGGAVIDACVFHEWPTTTALAAYLPDGWRELLTEPGVFVLGTPIYPNYLASESPITSYDALGEILADGRRERVVLSYDKGILATTNHNHFVGQAVTEAANRWTEEEWLTRDERLYGLVAAHCSLPDEAAKEIRRSGANPRMVGVLVGAATLGSPLGHPIYHPILEAAAEMGLPLVLQAGVDATENALPSPVAGGLPATAAEYRSLSWHAQMAHLNSLILQGVFDKFPTLRVLLLGAGALWLPGHFWRLDYRFGVTRGDGRWLKKRPIDYFDRFFVSTFRLDRPTQDDRLAQALSVIPGIEQRLLYASGMPDHDADEVPDALSGIPASWQAGVLFDNALDFFRWPGESPNSRNQSSQEEAALA